VRGRLLRRVRGIALAALAVACALPAIAGAAFPPEKPPPGNGPEGDPSESVRANSPNDPAFDRCEPDNVGGATCSNVFDQQYPLFGFAPNASQVSAPYANPTDSHVQRLGEQNTKAGRSPLGQVPGVSADRAWKYTTGLASVQVAILDTGIRWNNGGLRNKIALRAAELPRPQNGTTTCAVYDCDDNGAFNVDDYADDPRVSESAGHNEADGMLDGSDLLAVFSDGADGVGGATDANGYVDDIVGWDFFDDDNDPYDASSYSSASNHGTGRASEAGERGNDGAGGLGVCPRCQIVPMRVWDTFVVDTNNFAMAATYAADNEIEVVEGAVGALFNSRFARQAFAYAYRKGTFFTIVSSDLNTADHNVPTLYNEALQVQGTVADVQGLGENYPEEFQNFVNRFPLAPPLGSNLPPQTWFRNSGTTQYGGHAHIVMPAVTGSQATGQASGAAGLLMSYGRRKGTPLAPNEVKQLMTLTSQDVVAENTAPGRGVPDPAQPGWDQHFGYGLPDLGLAMEKIDEGKIPPQALIKSPDWFAPLNLARQTSVDVAGRIAAPRAAGFSYKLEWAPGIEPANGDFQKIGEGSGSGSFEGKLGTVDLAQVRAALDARVVPCPSHPSARGGATCDPTAPSRGPTDPEPNEPAFTVRVVVNDSAGNRGEDRKMLFAYRDQTLHPGWARDLDSGGEASPRLFDFDANNRLDVVQADSSGFLTVRRSDGTPVGRFNDGRPVKSKPYPNVHRGAPVYSAIEPPREVLRTPAIGDIDGDLEPEIVDSAGEHVYAWERDGKRVPGFPVRIDPSKSEPEDRTRDNHVKRGFSASPALGDFNDDGKLDIAIAALDQHLYAWDGTGTPLPGFPVLLKKPGEDLVGAESINTAAVGDIDGDDKPDIVVATNEVAESECDPPPGFEGPAGTFACLAQNVATGQGTTGRVYAVNGQGDFLDNWPISPSGLLPDVLPFVGPGVDHVLGDVSDDGKLDVIGNISSGELRATDGSTGSQIREYPTAPVEGEAVDRTKALNLFENPIVADFDDTNPGLEVAKGGMTLAGLVNLGVAVGQNLPYNHLLMAWSGNNGNSLAAYPQTVEDYQLLSSPAVADVSDAPGKELVVGTGLYFVRSMNAAGLEGAGWPKFTGGWNFAVPAIGDADDDGKLDVASLTREGFAFLWKTDRPACGGNAEWWTSRHDEHNSGAYTTDARPPGKPKALIAFKQNRVATLRWTAPGDDWMCGTAARFRVLASPDKIKRPTQGTPVGPDVTVTKGAGETETFTAPVPRGTRFVAVLYQDEAGNWGHQNNEPFTPAGTRRSIESPDG